MCAWWRSIAAVVLLVASCGSEPIQSAPPDAAPADAPPLPPDVPLPPDAEEPPDTTPVDASVDAPAPDAIADITFNVTLSTAGATCNGGPAGPAATGRATLLVRASGNVEIYNFEYSGL